MVRYRGYNDEIVVYTDGCALRNGQWNAKGGWAIVFGDGNFNDDSGYFLDGPQTNNRYELEAIRAAIDVCLDTCLSEREVYDVTVCTDSHYAMKAVTKWIHKWRENDWTTCQGTPVQNAHLIENIDNMIDEMYDFGGSVHIKHVQAHNGNYYNEKADRMAKDAAWMNPLFNY